MFNLKNIDFIFYLSKEKLQEFVFFIDNDFWRDVIKALIQVKKSPEHVLDYLCLDIRNFCCVKKWALYSKWTDNGVKRLEDLVSENGNIRCFNEIKGVLGTNNFLDYFHVISKIPSKVKRDIIGLKEGRMDKNNECTECVVHKLLSTCNSKYLYQILKRKEFIATTLKKNKWETLLDESLSDKEWKFYFVNASLCTKDTKIIYFQYRILMNYIATNSFLHKIKISDNNLCTFCKCEAETITHIFYDCVQVNLFWNDFVQWFNAIENDYKISKKIVLLGNTEGSCLENFLLLVAKKFIYYSRSQGTRPKFSEAVNLFKFYRNMENYCEKVFKCKSKMLSKWAIYDIVYNK